MSTRRDNVPMKRLPGACGPLCNKVAIRTQPSRIDTVESEKLFFFIAFGPTIIVLILCIWAASVFLIIEVFKLMREHLIENVKAYKEHRNATKRRQPAEPVGHKTNPQTPPSPSSYLLPPSLSRDQKAQRPRDRKSMDCDL